MKKLLLIPVLFLSLFANAQCYTVSTVNYNPDPFTGGTPVTVTDDGWSVKIPIGFSFCFYGASYDTLIIGANGIISFNASQASGYCQWPVNSAIPSPALPMNTIMVGWQDLQPTSGGTIKYAVYGNSPNRRFVASFSAVPMYVCSTQVFTGQVALYESTNVVEIYIQDKFTCPQWNGGYAIEGLHNKTGTSAVPVPGRNYPTSWTATNDAKRFTPSCNVCSGVSVGDEKENTLSLKLFPNPSNGIFHVELEGERSATMQIMNALGQTVFLSEISGSSMIELSTLPKGMYLYTVTSPNGKQGSGKLQIE